MNIKDLVNCVAWAPWNYGLILLAAGSDGMISFIPHNQNNWNVIQFMGHKCGITCIAWAPYSDNKASFGEVRI